MNTQAEILPKIENKLRTITRLKFRSEKIKIFIQSLFTDWDVHVYKDLLELVGSSGAGTVVSKLVTFADAFSSFFAYGWMKQWQTSIS